MKWATVNRLHREASDRAWECLSVQEVVSWLLPYDRWAVAHGGYSISALSLADRKHVARGGELPGVTDVPALDPSELKPAPDGVYWREERIASEEEWLAFLNVHERLGYDRTPWEVVP